MDSSGQFVVCDDCVSILILVGQVSNVLERWEFTSLLLFPCWPLWQTKFESLAECSVGMTAWSALLSVQHSLAAKPELSATKTSSKQAASRKMFWIGSYTAVSGKRWTLLNDRLASWISNASNSLRNISEQFFLSFGRMPLGFPEIENCLSNSSLHFMAGSWKLSLRRL